MGILSIHNLSKKYSSKSKFAVDKISLEVAKGEFLALIGESGCGKTTLLRLIAGFEVPDSGQIILNEKVISSEQQFVKPEQRKIGMVFQDYALFPHLTVTENIAFGLGHLSKEEREQRIKEILELVGLQVYAKRYPHLLSGGQQQRVALARALAPQPNLILLDEPFSNLDAVLKEQVRDDVRNIIKKAGATAIFVTHDTKDALSTADRIAILKEGKIQQLGTPQELYEHPKNLYVANFFGKVNTLNAEASAAGFSFSAGVLKTSQSPGAEGKVVMAIRPEHIQLTHEQGENVFEAEIRGIHYYGDHKKAYAILGNGKKIKLILNLSNDHFLTDGQLVRLKINADKVQILDTCWYPALLG
jgi:iron(III) transport system ATP-binding protein